MTDSGIMTIGLVLLAYLWGSIPTAVLVCHMLKIPDPRQQGSGNPGTTNVLRIGTRRAAILTLLGDTGKGVLALLPCILADLNFEIRSYCTLAVVLGHLFPVFSSFRGGKGVATTLGAGIGLFWPLAIIQLLTWGIIALIGRISSLASIGTALTAPIFAWILIPELTPAYLLLSGLLLFSHRTNIRKLLSASEPRL